VPSGVVTRKRILMIAFHFPPLQGSSGIQRTLGFARYLPEFGWEPEILTVRPDVYDAIAQASVTPEGLVVHRTHAIDAARAFAVRDRYPSFLAQPDRWSSWRWTAIPKALSLVRRIKPHVLWSTYPIATAHAIAHAIARLTGIRWVADFRDPMAQDGYPVDKRTWESFRRVESRTVARAHRSVFTTAGAARMYQARYPERRERIGVIENGYDEEMFEGLRPTSPPGTRQCTLLLHSGIVYPSERDPSALFAALRTLMERGIAVPGRFILRLRAAVHDSFIRGVAERSGVLDLIELAPPLPYREALAEMIDADGLVVLQAANCNEQIPAKLYEYLRAGRPILGLADPAGDTADALRRAGITHIAALENAESIATTLSDFLDAIATKRVPALSHRDIANASRRARTRELAAALEAVAQEDAGD